MVKVYESFSRPKAEMTGQVEIYCDSEDEISGLPTYYAPGSVAIVVVEGTPTYMLNPSKVWVKV